MLFASCDLFGYFSRNHAYETPLHGACYSGNTRILARMLEAGGDLRLHDNMGRTPTNYADMQLDLKKRTKMREFIKKARQLAMMHSDSGKYLPLDRTTR